MHLCIFNTQYWFIFTKLVTLSAFDLTADISILASVFSQHGFNFWGMASHTMGPALAITATKRHVIRGYP